MDDFIFEELIVCLEDVAEFVKANPKITTSIALKIWDELQRKHKKR